MRTLLLVLLLIVAPSSRARADGPLPEILEHARFDQRLGDHVPLDLAFRDESGKQVRLAGFFHGKPVILTLNYYECPNLCPLVIDGLVVGLVGVPFTIGNEFEVVTVSIDPRETPDLAASTKERVLRRYVKRPAGADGWHFLTGDRASIDRLAAAVGFNYAYDEEAQQYAHPAGAIVLTPAGEIARYIYGVEFSPTDLRLALVEASQNKIASPVDHILLFCYRYDPIEGRYNAIALNSMRLAGLATVVGLGLFVSLMLRREARRGSRNSGALV